MHTYIILSDLIKDYILKISTSSWIFIQFIRLLLELRQCRLAQFDKL